MVILYVSENILTWHRSVLVMMTGLGLPMLLRDEGAKTVFTNVPGVSPTFMR